jgi:hypothetical protein
MQSLHTVFSIWVECGFVVEMAIMIIAASPTAASIHLTIGKVCY